MRISIIFDAEDEVQLPLQYNHILQGFIYCSLSNRDYREFLHTTGYSFGQRRFKLFTFSRLLGLFKINKQKKRIYFQAPFELIVASPLEPFITDLAETLIRSEFCFLGNNRVEIRGINVHRNVEFDDYVRVKMLSPMVTYSTLTNGRGRKFTEYHSPWEECFNEIVKNNLLSKYQILYGSRLLNDEFKVIPYGMQEEKCKTITSYKNFIIEGYIGIYWLMGNPDLIKVAYETGLGSKNSQGFGCWELV